MMFRVGDQGAKSAKTPIDTEKNDDIDEEYAGLGGMDDTKIASPFSTKTMTKKIKNNIPPATTKNLNNSSIDIVHNISNKLMPKALPSQNANNKLVS